MKIYQEKISNEHNDSLFYDGLIAENGKYKLYATGEIDIRYENGNDFGRHNGIKSYDDFPIEIENDHDIQKIFNDSNYRWEMNNWFEIITDGEAGFGDMIYGNYDDAIQALKEVKE
jgi:hypothetical protein